MIKDKKFFIKLSEKIRLSQPKSKKKYCYICGKLIKEVGVIAYLSQWFGKDENEKKGATPYSWFHFRCFLQLEEPTLIKPDKMMYNIWDSMNFHCSYCNNKIEKVVLCFDKSDSLYSPTNFYYRDLGKDEGFYNIGNIMIHKNCFLILKDHMDRELKNHRAEIVSRLI